MQILFINSKHFWLNGWLNTPEHLKYAMSTLRKLGFTVASTEISNAKELQLTLDTLPGNTIIWPNAYYTGDASGEIVWLQDFIESRNLPFVGTSVQGLKNMLHKTLTHQLLRQANVATPDYLSISRTQFNCFESMLENSDLQWPVVVKPSGESCSMGVRKVETAGEAKQHIEHLFREFPESEALLETFLPSEDITCGFMSLGNEIILLPTYYKSLELSGKTHIAERDIGTGPWGGSSIIVPAIKETNLLDQLQDQMPKLARAIGGISITRVDARTDEQGTLRFFDVNGMPALSYPSSIIVRQVRQCFPELSNLQAYEYLLKTIVLMTTKRFNMAIPSLPEENLFSLDSDHIIRLSVLENA